MRNFVSCAVTAVFILFCSTAGADALSEGKGMVSSGNLEGAAEFFSGYAAKNPKDREGAPEALALAGRLLDSLSDPLTGRAEKSCYWGKGKGSPDCMRRFAAEYNSRFGEGSFEYRGVVNMITYTGSHYRRLASQYPKSRYAPEADFYILLRGLVGQPDEVLKRVKAFLSKHRKGEWNRKGTLLLARVNADIWRVYRRQGWFLSNSRISKEDMIILAESYRQEAMKLYSKLMRDAESFEGKAAAREHEDLLNNRDEGIVYSIVNDSTPGTLAAWGITVPAFAPTSVPQIRSAPPAAELKPPMPPPPVREEQKVKRPPSRWN